MAKDKFLHMRVDDETRAMLEALCAAETDNPRMSEMVRLLISRAHRNLSRKASRKKQPR